MKACMYVHTPFRPQAVLQKLWEEHEGVKSLPPVQLSTPAALTLENCCGMACESQPSQNILSVNRPLKPLYVLNSEASELRGGLGMEIADGVC